MSFVAVAIGGAAVIGGAATIISSNRQASAAESTAAANADATRAQAAALMHQADAGLEAAKITGQAGIEASKNSMKAAITAAALGQTQTTDTVQHLSPVQLGANAIASYDMALKWNKFMALTEQGYQPGAKNWLLAGKDGKVLYKDPTYNLLAMGQQVKDASLSAMNLVGVKSAANPYGVNLSFDQYKVMMAMKHPEDMLEPSAADKAAYQSRFNAWAASHPMEAALLKDPQQNLHDQLGDKSPDPGGQQRQRHWRHLRRSGPRGHCRIRQARHRSLGPRPVEDVVRALGPRCARTRLADFLRAQAWIPGDER
jgi:hypothetical protein